MADKAFSELTKEEATELARRIVNSSYSEEQIRERLTQAGFNSRGAAVATTSSGGEFMVMIMVWGPHGGLISV